MRNISPTPARPSQAVGRTVTLLLVPTGPAVPFGPMWAVLCGACAAARWQWKSAYESLLIWLSDVLYSPNVLYPLNTLVALLLTVFIAEALWSTWRALLIDGCWARHSTPGALLARGDPMPRPLYTAPWSPIGRFLGRWSQTRRWRGEALPVETGSALFTLPILPPLTLLLSAVVGRHLVILSLAALSLSLIEWLVARRGQSHDALRAALQIGLSWLAGHTVFGQLTWSSFTLACCYAIAYQGALCLGKGTPSPDRDRRLWSLALLYGGQIAALVLLVLLEQPLAATVVGLLLAPQLLLLSRLETGEQNIWYLQRAIPFLMVAMPIAARVA